MATSKNSVRKMPKPKSVMAQSVTQFLSEVYKLEASRGIRCFRGEANTTWKLMPSVMRDLRPEAENNIISELMAESPMEFSEDLSMFSKLVRAQHYGLPTRLLDVSLNPLVALYFACADDTQKDEDGKVLILDFRRANIRYPDSDTVSLICNLARLTDSERDQLKKVGLNKKIPDAQFQILPSAERLAQFVRMEKPYFLNLMRAVDFRKYFFVHPSKTNRRVIAQSGAFVAAGLLSYKTSKNIVSFDLSNITIPADYKENIIKELDILNINARSLFPEIEYTSKYIKNKWLKHGDQSVISVTGISFKTK